MSTRKVRGKYFEELVEGAEFTTPSRTITEADIAQYIRISGDYARIYSDEQFAKDSLYKGRVAPGLIAFVFSTGLMARLGVWEGTVMAGFGQSWKFLHPIRVGDTLTVKLKIAEKRETKKADRGIIKRVISILNQKGEVVVEGQGEIMIARKAGDQ